MKPIKLTMSGWGPYKNKTVIPFYEFQESELFLITGATGAGKTTIFDSISFALFGDVSGRMREKNSVRSDFADSDTETYVEFVFEHRGVIYTSNRTPRYERPKKRGTGMITVQETAKLQKEKEEPISGITEVNHQIEWILGINYDQFKQISMIAQGEFLELLTMNSNERGLILRKLFQTEKYDNIAKILSEESRVLEREIREMKLKMEEALGGVDVGESKEWKDFMNSEHPFFDKLCDFIRNWLEKEKKRDIFLRDQSENLDIQIKQLVVTIEQGKQREQVRKKQLELEKEMRELAPLLEESQIKLGKVKQWEENTQALRKNRERLEEYLPVLAKLEQLEHGKKELMKKQQEWEVEIEQVKVEEANWKIQYKEGMEKRNQFVDLEKRIEENRKKAEQLLRRKEAFEEIQQRKNHLKKSREVLTKLLDTYQSVYEKRQWILEKYERKEEAYRAAAIGLAARYLREGEPCPVCGSLSHPNKALLAEGTVDEKEVKAWKKKKDTIQIEFDRVYQESAIQKGKVEKETEELEKKQKESGDEKGEELYQELESVLKEGENFRKQQKEKEKNEGKLVSLEGNRIQQEEKKRKIQEGFLDNKGQLDGLNGSLASLYESLSRELVAGTEEIGKPFHSQNQHSSQEIRMKIKEEMEQLLSKEKELERLIQESREKYNMLAARMEKAVILSEENKKAQIGEKISENTLLADSKLLMQMEEEKNKIRQEKEVLSGCIRGNQKALESIEKKQIKLKELESRYGIIKDLDNVTKGNNPMRVVLEHYVLSSYFEEILSWANQRFLEITSGRYELLRVNRVLDARTKGFLDLEVMDYYTGKKRSVKTLSGGEAFKAALCLALGLSDVVQNHAGGIQIDILFIDEGFGGLDSESLNQALTTLMNLSKNHRMIGIISHVEELKEKVENQIVIEKSNCGSRLKLCGNLVS